MSTCSRCNRDHAGTGKCCTECQSQAREYGRQHRRSHPSRPNPWTDARIARLMELLADGLGAGQISEELGAGISRNAVIGKIHRLTGHKTGEASPLRKPPREPKPRPPRRPSGLAADSVLRNDG